MEGKQAEEKMIKAIEEYLEMKTDNFAATIEYWGEFQEKKQLI